MDIEAAKAHSNVAVLLTLSGGFLDAFTYLGHGKVFANSMTGNIVLLAVNLAAGDWHQAAKHVSPLVGFACGILAARLLQLMSPRWVRQPVIAALIFEIVFPIQRKVVRTAADCRWSSPTCRSPFRSA
jgi:uncharacterized membrane protein YoaK (UPF0700 family)